MKKQIVKFCLAALLTMVSAGIAQAQPGMNSQRAGGTTTTRPAAPRTSTPRTTQHATTHTPPSQQSGSPSRRTKVEVIYGYLKVFPDEIGEFSSEPVNVIRNVNAQAQYGYNNWRIPTAEEISLLKAKKLLGEGKYMTREDPTGIVLLVTDGEDAVTLAAVEAAARKAAEEAAAREAAEEAAARKAAEEAKYGVDLGLSVRWATCNLGASKPEDYGNYYAWGETATKSSYTGANYKYSGNPSELPSSADVAHIKLGGSWRMPTDAEFEELCSKCKWEWTTLNYVTGYKVTGPNGNSIFFPAAGYRSDTGLNDAGSYGYYWSSSRYTGWPGLAWGVNFNSAYVSRSYYFCCYGLSVRPVSE